MNVLLQREKLNLKLNVSVCLISAHAFIPLQQFHANIGVPSMYCIPLLAGKEFLSLLLHRTCYVVTFCLLLDCKTLDAVTVSAPAHINTYNLGCANLRKKHKSAAHRSCVYSRHTQNSGTILTTEQIHKYCTTL